MSVKITLGHHVKCNILEKISSKFKLKVTHDYLLNMNTQVLYLRMFGHNGCGLLCSWCTWVLRAPKHKDFKLLLK